MSAMFFDIKDISSDKEERLKTFAVVWGKERTIRALIILNLLSAVPLIIGVYLDILPWFSLALLLTLPYTFYYLNQTRKKIRRFYTTSSPMASLCSGCRM